MTGAGLALSVSAQSAGFRQLMMPGPVSEAHARIESDCEACHGTREISPTAACLECHEPILGDIEGRTGLHGHLLESTSSCDSCHTEHEGRDGDIVGFDRESFDHALADFTLEGAHATAFCNDCHRPGSAFREAPSDCHQCHQQDDPHKGGLGEACDSCHEVVAWVEVRFDHHAETGFALRDGHALVSCDSCHPDNRYQNTKDQCLACHVLNDRHAGRFGDQCEQCHQATGWGNLVFDHGRDTDFALQGAHRHLKCDTCHQSGSPDQVAGVACVDCHSVNDVHFGANGSGCADCHDENNWNSARFDHDSDTPFPLTGQHTGLSCNGCHVPGESAHTRKQCEDCHRQDSPHQSFGSVQCDQCHSPTGWSEETRFSHDLTRFPLLGLHGLASCEACHQDLSFEPVSTRCVECHKDADVHNGGLGSQCQQCHNPNGWAIWLFDHDRDTDFDLNTAHGDLACEACHAAPVKSADDPRRCADCHREDDVHRNRFGQQCDRCHVATTFRDIRIRESQR